MARNNLGDAWRESGRPREAMQAYRAAVETDADYLPAWRNLGLTFYQVKGEAGVTQALQKLQAVDPELADQTLLGAGKRGQLGEVRLQGGEGLR